MRYLNEKKVKNVGGSKTLFLTEPLNMIGVDFGDDVTVMVDGNKIIIEKVMK